MAAKGVAKLSRADKLQLYYWMRLTRTLEERLVNLHRQNKLVGGLFRSLGQEADAVGSAFALQPNDVLSSLTRNLGSLLIKGATPVEVIRQHMATVDSPTRGRDLGLHFADLSRGFIGHISPLGAYDAQSDSFLVLDVNPAAGGWVWMPSATLIRGMRTFDTVENRGYVVVTPR